MRAQRRWFHGLALTVGTFAAVTWWAGSAEPIAALASSGAEAHAAAAAAVVEVTPAVGSAREPTATAAAVERDLAVDPAPVDPARIAVWVADLRDDGIRGNAIVACAQLIAAPRGALPAVEAALGSADPQQRHLAARVLRRRCERHELPPSAGLLAVTVEGLSHEVGERLAALQLSRDWSCRSDCARFLSSHARAAEASLRAALHARDGQQRFLAAWLLAQAGCDAGADALCRELLPHLADNTIAGDALMAAHGLYRLGERALPALRWWHTYGDAQARSLIETIERDLLDPPASRAEMARRRHGRTVTSVYHDPAIEFDVHRSLVPSWSTP